MPRGIITATQGSNHESVAHACSGRHAGGAWLPYVFTHVDKNGVETSVTDAAFNLATTQLGPPGLAQNPADSKGFFAIKTPLGPGLPKLVRFNYK